MWALRRASVPLRNQGFNVGTARACCVKLTPIACVEEETSFTECSPIMYNRSLLLNTVQYHSGFASLRLFVSRRELSSQADAKSTKADDDLEDGFSELETPTGGNNNELTSESDLSEEEEGAEEPNELGLSDTESDPTEKKSKPAMRAVSNLAKAIITTPASSIHSILENWVKEGKELSRSEVSSAMFSLRRGGMYRRALQLLEWLKEKNKFEFTEKEYSSMVDLIAKLHGFHKAENYIESIPESFRGELVYRTLLANCVIQRNEKKSEEVFNKMRDLEFPLTSVVCNQLLLLYRRIDRKKIADVLLLMEKENVKPNLFTYQILINTKGLTNDIAGMDQIVETMRAEGIEPDMRVKQILVRCYVKAGLTKKAEDILREMEGEDIKNNRLMCRVLLPLYADLRKVDDVERIWKVCESNPQLGESIAAIEAWGKLKKVEEAEKVFEIVMDKWNRITSRHFTLLLNVYTNNGMLVKGKDLIKRMAGSGCRMGPLTWHALVKLYVRAGEVEKADSVLQKAVQQRQMKPLFSSYMVVLDQYARKGDIRNSENIFYRMRQVGHNSSICLYHALVQAYINAKKPAYGMRERLKADNIFPNKSLAAGLAHVDAFRKTDASDLLD